ncbi:MAG: hypothetical protein HFE79_00020 [Ruminiclostridium sp.]|jgi:hypothetical protein|nr:hypothetical protein [Ruminiclostridium sp.]
MKPILFNTEMVRAILNGRKMVTRRVIKPKYTNTTIISKSGKVFETGGTPATTAEIKFLYEAGDILYVRETYCAFDTDHIIDGVKYAYKADSTSESESVRKKFGYKWLPSIHMPKEAARIFLRVTDVRVERLQDMNMNDIQDEGVVPNSVKGGQWQQWQRDYMKPVWNSTVKKSDLNKYGWNANPWVWVTKFEKINKEDTPWKENTTR